MPLRRVDARMATSAAIGILVPPGPRTFVVVRLRGSIGDEEIAGLVRYTRTWVRGRDGWRVLAAHIAPLPG